VVAVGDQSDWVTKNGTREMEKMEMDGWEAGWRGVAAWVVVLSVGLRPTSLALVGLRPKPRAARC
jgi:hypothetical protein